MTFSLVTKDELARVTGDNRCCKLAELTALIKTNGSLHLSKDHQVTLSIVTESAALARKIFLLIKEIFQTYADVLVQRKRRLRRNNIYIVRISSQPHILGILESLSLLGGERGLEDGIPGKLVRRDCCRRAYLRGAFLSSGSVNNPASNYHLEMVVGSKLYAQDICRLMQKFHLHPGLIIRKNDYVIYLKDGEQIAYCLNLMGAHTALLNLENIRVYKNMRNQINRLVNCETANLSKTVNASLHQLETIRFLALTMGIEKLPPSLRQVASARLAYPDASLKELGDLLEPKVSKSGVRYRLGKLEEIAHKKIGER